MRLKLKKRIIIAAALLTVCAAVLLILNLKSGSTPLDTHQVAAILDAAEYPNEAAKTAVSSAASLIGSVRYFWGGKSFCIGPDPEWGKAKTVASEGHSTTGKVLPYGLDCSGLVTWAYIQAGYSMDDIGNGTWSQWFNSEEIDKSELRPGDLGFQNRYPGSSGNHVGIFIGYYKAKPVFIHSAPGYDGVVATCGDGAFKYYRRPLPHDDLDEGSAAATQDDLIFGMAGG